MDELWDDYLQYLIWRGGLEKMIQYEKLFDILHHIDFTWIIERDDNRAEAGICLRDNYDIPYDFTEEEIDEFMNRRCSVLEMLLALAIKVDDDIIGDPAEEHPEKFFMEMIKNLGLDKFKGDRYSKYGVIKIVNNWLNRNFNRDGTGSPFPVKRNHKDQRRLEIWDQMNAYIIENY